MSIRIHVNKKNDVRYGSVQSWHLTDDIGDDKVDVDGDDQKGEEGGKNPRNNAVREIPHNPAQKTTSRWLNDCLEKKNPRRGSWEVFCIQNKNLITYKFERIVQGMTTKESNTKIRQSISRHYLFTYL